MESQLTQSIDVRHDPNAVQLTNISRRMRPRHQPFHMPQPFLTHIILHYCVAAAKGVLGFQPVPEEKNGCWSRGRIT